MQERETGVEKRLSELARGAALVRALAAHDEREEIRCGDTLAELFVSDDRQGSVSDPKTRDWLVNNYLPYGVYAYTLSRTAYMDHIVAEALRDNIEQIVLVGAGYDSRPYRFAHMARGTVIFELDDGELLERKRKFLTEAGINPPAGIKYVPLSYNSVLMREALFAAGFEREKQTLFVWEGCSYYLKSDNVDRIIRFMGANSPAGSTLCFDYSTGSKEMESSGLGKELSEPMGLAGSEDADLFRIEEDKTGRFLAERNFMILEDLTPQEMEKRYLTLSDGSLAGKVPARYRIVYASLSK
jgi:methyltransferase (TIGR00027 family)